jgi:sulfonate transport system substrate-binding protein
MARKCFLFAGVLLLSCMLLAGCGKETDSAADGKEEKTIRIGYQKNGPLLILKSLGTLEERFEKEGYHVEWKEFQEGPALVEALNAGGIDFGRTGNSPPIFAQVSGAPFVTIAAGKSKYYGSGILVPEDSEIKTIGDLKGKKVSFAKGSSSHYLIVKALKEAGLSYADITPAFLTPGDARVAFEQKNIDAMAVWDPYTASTEMNANGIMLTDGEGLSTDRDFFLANEQFAENNQQMISLLMEEVAASADWANTHHKELIDMLVPVLKLDEASVKMAVERREYGVEQINEDIIKEQQEIADIFYELDIIPKEIQVRDVMK